MSAGAPAAADESSDRVDITEIVHATLSGEQIVPPEPQYERHSGDVPAAIPNSPSSPVWSLLDHQASHSIPPREDETGPAKQRETRIAETPADEILTRIPEPPPEAVTAEPPREARKGWWQRRFKG